MNYLWNDFNIKTFNSETIVFRDGIYMPDISTLEYGDINNKYDLPIHIIYVGEISGDNNLDININSDETNVFLTVKLKNNLPAKLNINVKNAGKKSFLRGNVIIENYSKFHLNNICEHKNTDTEIIIKTKIFASEKSESVLYGSAVIGKNLLGCISDINFGAIAETGAQIEFCPKQYISAPPVDAEHSAYMYKPTDFQIQYLKESGLDHKKALNVLSDAFLEK